MPNWKKVIVSGSDAVLNSVKVSTNITASNISASGNLFANISDNSSTSFKTVVVDPTTGQLYRTGSYGSGGGGGTGNGFPFEGDALITGSLTISQSYTAGDTDSTALRLIGSGSVSQSGIFEVEGSAGPLFSVQDGLDGILMEVNNISGLPLFQVSSSNEIFINRGNLTSGTTTATASFANFSGSFQGDGTNLNLANNTTIPTSNPFPFTGDAQITGSLIVSGSSSPLISLPNAPTNAVIISGSNNRTRLHIHDSGMDSGPTYNEGAGIVLSGGVGNNKQATLEISAVGSTNGGGNNEQTFIRSNQQLVIQGGDNDAGDNIKFLGSNFGIGFDASNSGVSLTYFTNGGSTVSTFSMGNGTYTKADANGTYYKIGRSSTDWLNLSSTKATFAADVSSSSATSTASFGTYIGDGSQLTNLPAATAGSTAGRVVFTTTNGELTTESGFEYNSTTDQLKVHSLDVVHLTSSFITSSRIHTSGSNIFGDDTTDTQTLIGTTKITGSAQITGSTSILGDTQITGSLTISGSSGVEINNSLLVTGSGANITIANTLSGAQNSFEILNNSNQKIFQVGNQDRIVFGAGATSTDGTSLVWGGTATSQAQYAVVLGYSADHTTGTRGIAIGLHAQSTEIGAIAIGAGASAHKNSVTIGRNVAYSGTPENSLVFSTFGGNNVTYSTSNAFEWYNTHATAPNLRFLAGPTSQSFWSGSGGFFGFGTTTPDAPLTVEGSGSTVFNVIGSQGTLFSITDNLTQGSLFAVKDINGFPLLDVTRNTSSADIVTVGQSNLILDSGSLQTTGSINVTGSVNLSDGTRLNLGNSGDLKIYHDGSNSYIDETGTGALFYRGGTQTFQNAAGTKTMLTLNAASSVDLRFDNSTKLSTTNTGIEVTGEITASGNISSSATSTASFGHYIGDGSQLTNLPTSDPFPFTGDAQITGSLLISGSKIHLRGESASPGPILELESINGGSGKDVYVKVGDSNENYAYVFGADDTGNTFRISKGGYSSATLGTNDKFIIDGNNIEFPAGNISGSITSTASFGHYIGDGSQLTGISAGTDFTQSLFVSPSGDNSTAVVGDMSKPFATILGATGSANPGDTIIVYPGKYIENNNLYKDGVNYHFIDGAIVESTNPVEPMWGGGGGGANGIEYFSSPVSITGHGEFINTSNTVRTGTIFYLGAPSGIIEFKKAFRAGIGGTSYVTAANFAQQRTADAYGVLTVKGEVENSGSGGNLGSVVGFLDGNINAELIVRQHKSAGTAVKIWGSNCDLNATMDVYSEGMAVEVAQRTNALTVLKGRYETLTSNQGTYYCIDAGYNSRGSTLIDAEVRGAIKIEHGSQYEGSTTIMGYQQVSNSPGGAACVIVDGQNQLSQRIYSGQPAFKITGGQTTFDGSVRHTGYNSKVFDISAGTFNWKGTCTGNTSHPTTRTDPNVVSGGELIIESQFECFSQTANVNNEYMFNLSGGTLDIRNKLRNNINSLNNGIVNMTGGYLKMNGAELVHATQTGSFAYAIDLNGQSHSGSILNNSFTNLTPFGLGSFTNEITGGGTLFYSDKLY